MTWTSDNTSWQSFNPVNPDSDNFIGGQRNCIDATPGMPTSFASIGGGQMNCIHPGANHASIFGGNNNMVSGACSAIFGGSGNNDGGLNNVFIAGSGINAGVVGTPNSIYVNGINANAIPNIPLGIGAVPGQIYWDAPGSPGKVLYIF